MYSLSPRGEGWGEGVFDPAHHRPCRCGTRPPHPDPLPGGEREGGVMDLVTISVLLLGLLAVLLAGGLWIAISLMAVGYVGMQFVGGGIPAGSVLATTIWGNSAS